MALRADRARPADLPRRRRRIVLWRRLKRNAGVKLDTAGHRPQEHRGPRQSGNRECDVRKMIAPPAPRLPARAMITLPELAAEALGSFLAADIRDRFGASHARLAEIIPFAARLALECIGNSDALYHNVEHTMLATLAGHDIFKGRALLMHSTPADYSNFIVACLTHDIGYVRGIVKGDGNDGLVVDADGRKVSLPRGASDAALAPYHVERSKLFVLDRFAAKEELDGALIASAIEHTRFPFPSPSDDRASTNGRRCCALRTWLVSSAIRAIWERPMRSITNSRKSA